MFLFPLRQFVGNIHKEYNYQDKSCGYLSKGINLPEIHFSSFLSHQIVNTKNTIAKVRFNINVKKSYKSLGEVKLDPINGAANQAADKFIQSPEKALRYGRYFFLTIQK